MATRKTQAKPAVPETTYLVERGKERMRVTVPSDWKVTFGPMVPARGRDRGGMYGGYEAPNCLRFYESNDKQRAIFTGVTAFRDLSIPVERMVEKVEGKSETKKDHKGASVVAVEQREELWVEA